MTERILKQKTAKRVQRKVGLKAARRLWRIDELDEFSGS